MYNATVSPCAKGQIFLLTDKNPSKTEYTAHNYIIMSNICGNGRAIQAMSISSLSSGDKIGAVPVLLLNGKISFILPFNMYQFTYKDFDLKNYRGVVQNNIYPADKFMDMLIKLYLYFNNFETETSSEEIVRMYNEYIEQFWSIYDHKDEFRLTKDKFKIYPKSKSYQALHQDMNTLISPTGIYEDINDKCSTDKVKESQSKQKETTQRIITLEMIAEEEEEKLKKRVGRKPIFTEKEQKEIKEEYISGVKITTLSKKYKCSHTTISNIVK